MQFDSFTFILFLITTIGIYHLIKPWKLKKMVLLIASYVFYAAWSPVLIVLIWISTIVDFFLATKISTARTDRTKKLYLIGSLVTNLGLLSYFKYAEFLLGTFAEGLSRIGVDYSAPDLNIILPIGISFYTFQTLSYTIDVYRGKLEPTSSLLDFSLFVTFFPQLVAGPIVRAVDFLPQCIESKGLTAKQLTLGITLFIYGLFLKVVLADSWFGPVVDAFYADPSSYQQFASWIAIFSFSMQIFCDFAGYSLCAIGLAIMLGFALPENFNSPYAARGFSDFWKRWHISLSTWLRDYLYIGLGGNRKSRIFTFRNLMITMGLAGLWHGASINFIIWGLLHGVLLICEHGCRRQIERIPRMVVVLVTFVIVTLLWIPFRSPELGIITLVLNSLVIPHEEITKFAGIEHIQALIGIIGIFLIQYIYRSISLPQVLEKLTTSGVGVSVVIAIFAIAFYSSGDSNAFIYFQF